MIFLFGFLLAGILVSGIAQASQGWYLLLPPDNNPTAGVSKRWEQMGAYDTAKECQNALAERQARTPEEEKELEDYVYKKLTGQLTAQDEARAKLRGHIRLLWSYAVCVASDDPRLK